jgi:hypothetical protein
MKARLFLAAATAFVLLTAGSMAQNGAFEAALDRSTVGLGEQFTYSLTTSQTMSGGKNLQLPDSVNST